MLRRCLTAISKLAPCRQVGGLAVAVVDNEAEPNSRAIVEEFGALYVHEPRRGIANARNAAIEAAIRLEADFMTFTDDDCEPAENWLCGMLDAQRRDGADVVRGQRIYTYPQLLPWWVVPTKKIKPKDETARPGKVVLVSTSIANSHRTIGNRNLS
jgi:GT2 family glycosyltransferase